jgi:prepilin-type processing-associated H-X9-DG protein
LAPDYSEVVNGSDEIGLMGDNQSAWAGYEWDNHRVAWNPASQWGQEAYQPRHDQVDAGPAGAAGIFAFGSAHPDSLNMAYCDGSVRRVSYDVDPQLHRQAANRLDGGSD